MALILSSVRSIARFDDFSISRRTVILAEARGTSTVVLQVFIKCNILMAERIPIK